MHTLLNMLLGKTSPYSLYPVLPHHSSRLRDERKVTEIIARGQCYLEGRQESSRNTDLCHIYIRTIEHLYYKVSYTRLIFSPFTHNKYCILG